MLHAHATISMGCALALLLVSLAQEKQEKPPVWELKPPAPAVALRPPRLERLEGETCGECHADIVEEWAPTAHAVAWLDEVFQGEVKEKTRPQSCYGCHIPKPLLAAGLASRAEARVERRHLGISCESCHLGESGTMLGPWGARTDAHKTQASDYMTEKAGSSMCMVCHSTNIGPVVGIAKDFVVTRQAERGRSCLGCHMAPVERKPSKGALEGAAARAGRSHAFQTPRDPAFLRLAFEPTVRVEGGKSIVTIKNRAGHRVPGLIGREIELRAEALDGQGKVLGRGSLSIDAHAYLPVDWSVELAVEAAGDEVHLVGLHHDPRAEKPIPFLDLRLKP